MAIIEAEVVVAIVETISDLTVAEEAIIKAIKIINTINFTHMMMDHRLNNMAHHVHFKGEHDINNLIEKMSLVSSN